MNESHPTSMPMIHGLKLSKLKALESNAQAYQSHLGMLIYAMLMTHPDLVYSVGMLTKHTVTPGKAQ